MKKIISIILVLLLVLSIAPLSVFATEDSNLSMYKEIIRLDNGDFYGLIAGFDGSQDYHYQKLEGARLEVAQKMYNEWLASQSNLVPVHTDPRDHDLGWNCNTKYHWMECACGARFGEELHVDPLETENDYCKCGYHFSSNADLVTLWIKGCPGIKNFKKDQTEYTLNAYTYKDVKEIKISTRTHDSEATVELPEDLTLKEGENKFEIKVTAENKKVTKVYTVIVNKEPAK